MKVRSMIAAGVMALALVGCSNATDEAPSPSPAQETLTQPIEAEAQTATAPVEITLPSGDSTRITAVATDSNGVLNPPTDIGVVGWWVDSALPGDPGTTVVTGHVNSVSEGDGYADQFIDLEVGDEVSLKTEGDGIVKYKVEGIVYHNKASEFPADELNKLDGPNRLALITCGGEFVGPPWGYEDNVIVWGMLL